MENTEPRIDTAVSVAEATTATLRGAESTPHSEIRIPQSNIPQSNVLRILLLEDSPTDAELNERVLRKAGIEFDSLRVETRAAFVAALDEFRPDLILADYSLPGFDGLQALTIISERSPGMPYIFVTGAMGEEQAVKAIKLGASDYILKDRLARLPIAVQHALEERETKKKLRVSEQKFMQLFMRLPIPLGVVNKDGGIAYLNDRLTEVFGYTTDDVPTLNEWWPLAYPDESYRQRVMESWGAAVAKAEKEGMDIEPAEYRVTCKNGAERMVMIGGSIIEGNVLATFIDITERKESEIAFRTIVGAAATNIGAAFFHESVSSLSTWLGVECVIIGELVDGNKVRALAMQLNGKTIEHYEYALPGTPCNNVASKGYCEYQEGVCQLFPLDKDLSDMGAEAYVGVPIRDKNGKTIGVLCAISRHKIVPPPMLKGVFEVIAARAGTEIERTQAESQLNEQIEELRRWYEATLGREMRTIEVKREVNELLRQAGQPPRYPSAEQE